METKQCGTCKINKEITEFSKKYNKWSSKCKECHNEYYKKYWKNTDAYEKHKNRVNKNRRRGWQRHGIKDISLYLTDSQLCPICNTNKQEVIDHDHGCCDKSTSCGRCVRGYICSRCNTTLGYVSDNVELLNNLIKYLKASQSRGL